MTPNNYFKNIFSMIFIIIILMISSYVLLNYPGSQIKYILFTVVFNGFLLHSLCYQRFYMETFLAIFLWLGYWMKLSYHFILNDFYFQNPIGHFDFSADSWDRVLTISTIGGLGFLVGAKASRLFLKKSTLHLSPNNYQPGPLYEKFRRFLIPLFMVTLLIVTLLNLYFSIYQRGTVPKTHVPGMVYASLAWMLSVGFSLCAATFIFWEILAKKTATLGIFLCMCESFMTNMSILSRGFILNPSPQIYSLFLQPVHLVRKISVKEMIFLVGVFILFLTLSLTHTTIQRFQKYSNGNIDVENRNQITQNVKYNTGTLFVDRWVGGEGVMSVVGYEKISWNLFQLAMAEPYSESGTSFYDTEIAHSDYLRYFDAVKMKQHHFVSIPGIIAFLYYSGSLPFVFVITALIGCLFVLAEVFVFWMTKNPILCALFAESFSFKVMHFGYAPQRAFLYYGVFLFMVTVIAMIQHLCFAKKSPEHVMRSIHAQQSY